MSERALWFLVGFFCGLIGIITSSCVSTSAINKCVTACQYDSFDDGDIRASYINTYDKMFPLMCGKHEDTGEKFACGVSYGNVSFEAFKKKVEWACTKYCSGDPSDVEEDSENSN